MNPSNSSFLKGWRLIFSIYLLLLAGSYIIKNVRTAEHQQSQNRVEVHSSTSSQKIVIPYQDVYSGNQMNPETVLFLNISGKEDKSIDTIPESLSEKFRVIIPDFEAIVKINRQASDFSFSTGAELMIRFLDSLDVDNVHLIGYRYGSLVALNMANLSKNKVRSLDLLSSFGVQELEFLGGYHLNHGIYTAHLSMLYLIEYGVPHFGFLNYQKEISFLNTLNSSDQRKARRLFQNLKIAVQIQHCRDDGYASYNLAVEHKRIIPQSKLVSYDCSQIGNSKPAADDLSTFIESANNVNVEISNLAIAQSLIPFRGSESYRIEGFPLFVVMVLIIFATFVTEDLTCIGAGLMVARGLIGFWPAVIACLLGIFIGDILIYLLGRWLGASVLKKAPVKWFISTEDLDRTYHWFEAKGPVIIILSRFIPGSRFPTYLSAGILKSSFVMFILYFGIASILWTPLLVGSAVLAGQKLIYYFTLYQDYALLAVLGVVLLLMAVFKIFIPLLTYRGRRLLYGRMKRIRRWEFWPPYITYLPVCIYVLGLWVKYKKITVCTAANPAISEGGFIGESKSAILDQIKAKSSIADYTLVPAGLNLDSKLAAVHDFMKNHSLDFPVVLKPDKGERGIGVEIPKNEAQLKQALLKKTESFIVQQFITGEEFGIFYYRYPGEEKGHIFSITKKELLQVKGDGKHTLEHLILKNDRAVCLAQTHFDKHVDDLYDIPKKGERIKLVELGTHARGALFFDDSNSITNKLTNKIDEISKSFEGFYFGRYDIKVPSAEDLKEGKNIKVIELNGVTSESTNIYDPKFSFTKAIRILCHQWRICFRIGFENHKKGTVIPPVKSMFSKIFAEF